MVCRSVCHTSEPCKNGWTDRDAVEVEDSRGPRNHVLDGDPDPPWEGAILRGKGHPIVKYRITLRSSMQKWLNRSRCRLGLRLGYSAGNHILDRSPDRPTPPEGAIFGERRVHCKYRGFLPWAVQYGWTDRFAVWIVDSGGPKEAQVQSYSPGGASVPTWEGTLAPPGEYDWTVCLRRRCGLMSNYFDHKLVIIIAVRR